MATTTSPQTMPINHTHGEWCVVCVAHDKDNHTNMVVIGWHETTTMRHTMHHNNQHVGQCDGLEAKAQSGGVCVRWWLVKEATKQQVDVVGKATKANNSVTKVWWW